MKIAAGLMLNKSKQNLIISLSGGKDSTTLVLLAAERGLRIHSIVFFDTGWEFPAMYSHIDKLSHKVNFPLVRLTPKRDFKKELKINRWPSFRREWCRRRKINAINKYANKHDAIQLIGFAANEVNRTFSKEMSRKEVAFPLIEWGIAEKDSLAYCYKQGFDWNGLYNHFNRVSCFCCPFKKIGDYRKIKKHYPVLWRRMLKMDKMINPNRGFCGYKTVHDLDQRFSGEDRQLSLPLSVMR